MFSVLQISCSVTKPKLGLSLGTKLKICCTIVRVELEDIEQEGWISMFFGFFLSINSSPRLHRLCLNISNEVEISSF